MQRYNCCYSSTLNLEILINKFEFEKCLYLYQYRYSDYHIYHINNNIGQWQLISRNISGIIRKIQRHLPPPRNMSSAYPWFYSHKSENFGGCVKYETWSRNSRQWQSARTLIKYFILLFIRYHNCKYIFNQAADELQTRCIRSFRQKSHVFKSQSSKIMINLFVIFILFLLIICITIYE